MKAVSGLCYGAGRVEWRPGGMLMTQRASLMWVLLTALGAMTSVSLAAEALPRAVSARQSAVSAAGRSAPTYSRTAVSTNRTNVSTNRATVSSSRTTAAVANRSAAAYGRANVTTNRSAVSSNRAVVSASRVAVSTNRALVASLRTPAPAAKPARAAPVPETAGGVGATLKVGTLGLGLEATVGLNDYLGVRLGGNRASWDGKRDADEGTVYWDVSLQTYDALLDIHPFAGGFRLSGGLMVNQNKINLRADLNEPVELGGQEYTLSDMNGEVTFNTTAPYAGLGYGNAVSRDGRWHFSCDFGVMFQGSPKVDAHATASDPALQPMVDAALEREKAEVQEDADAYKYYPVIALGVSFRF